MLICINGFSFQIFKIQALIYIWLNISKLSLLLSYILVHLKCHFHNVFPKKSLEKCFSRTHFKLLYLRNEAYDIFWGRHFFIGNYVMLTRIITFKKMSLQYLVKDLINMQKLDRSGYLQYNLFLGDGKKDCTRPWS